MATDAQQTSSGVQALISRLRDDGVKAGRTEAERILADARREAARLVEDATAEAESMRDVARAEIARDREASVQALRLAQRDTVLELREGVTRHFKQHVKRLVSDNTCDQEFLRALILVLAGRVASDFVANRDAEILIDALLFGEMPTDTDEAAHARENGRHFVLGITGDMLREGIELVPSSAVTGGARVKVKGEDAEVDLSDTAVSELLIKHMLPRFQALLSGDDA